MEENVKKNFKLDLRQITGLITIKTPKCVTECICEYTHIQYNPKYLSFDEYVEKINNRINLQTFPDVSLEELEDPNIASLINNFISPEHHRWTSENRLCAFQHMISFFLDQIPEIPKAAFNFGHKSDSEPYKYNSCILYRICLFYHIEMNNFTTIEEMARSVTAISLGSEVLKTQINSAISYLSISELISLYNSPSLIKQSDPIIKASPQIFNSTNTFSTNRIEFSTSELEECYGLLTNNSYLICRITPNDHKEAVIITAVRYGINISEAINPLNQFRFISRSCFEGKMIINYVPYNDTNFMKKYLTNPFFYSVKNYWSEKLSVIYDDSALRKFVLDEGYSEKRAVLKNPISLLREIRNRSNVYFGYNPYCLEDKTAIGYEPVINIDPSLLLSIGIINHPLTLYYITISELTTWFETRKIFLDAISLEPIQSEVITKLKNHLFPLIKENTATGNIYAKCYRICIETENIATSLTEKAQELSCEVWSLVEEDKNKVASFFSTLRDLGLYMRGWKVDPASDKLPLKSLHTNARVCYQSQLEIFVTETCISIFDLLSTLPRSIVDKINILPLVMFNKTPTNPILMFGMSVNKSIYIDHSRKLIDCIRNLKNTSDMSSCIRTNSNWILISSIYYGELCGFKNTISINDIDSIA